MESLNAEVVTPTEWSSFLDGFSRQHQAWLVTLEEIPNPASRPFLEARALPLQGISADPDGRSISILIGKAPGRHLTHTIDQPSRLIVERTDEGIEQALRIEHRDGRATRVSFRSAVRPEEVDGLP
jgi:uncharacterized protein DUF5335